MTFTSIYFQYDNELISNRQAPIRDLMSYGISGYFVKYRNHRSQSTTSSKRIARSFFLLYAFDSNFPLIKRT